MKKKNLVVVSLIFLSIFLIGVGSSEEENLINNPCELEGLRQIDASGKIVYCLETMGFLQYTFAKEKGEVCLNNFECISNICAENKCVTKESLFEEKKTLGKSIWCFLTNPGSYFSSAQTEYNDCLAN